ncbi:MAG TPA: DUF4383 domain-containing protein [Baekduia sp.]|nr:DUF4383 domain-containing protein [Baekduia sp.]
MFGRKRRVDDDGIGADREVIVEHGPSLAKGPALTAGSILAAFGLASLLKNNDFPSFSASFPDADVQGTNFLGLEVNGWTAFFSITAGALLLFGAAQHHLAKLMSLLVGLALAACAVIAVIDGEDVLGLAAANTWTKLGFAIAGGLMLINALMPRRTRRREVLAPAPTTGAAARDDDTPAGAERRRRFGRPDRTAPPAPVAGTDEPHTTVADRGAADPTDAPTTTLRRDGS